ncbi:MAG: hypothetical protein HOG49_23140 [Candidatus Scalindua sp.]|jgi:hypothetical protein|nr:hypothetical protein [Candidatus Scalindua sp.]
MNRSIVQYFTESPESISKEIPKQPLAGGIQVKTTPQIPLTTKQAEFPTPKKIENPPPAASLVPNSGLKTTEKFGDGATTL